MIKEKTQSREEIISSEIKNLFESYGFDEYRMRKFEKYALYVTHKDFLVGEKVITFTDLGGELLALRPDVTLSIVKNSKASKNNSEKVYYDENVYREDKQSGSFKEINQLGVELIGRVGVVEAAETLTLAMNALSVISKDFVLAVSHIGFANALLRACGFDSQSYTEAKAALRSGSENELKAIAAKCNVPKNLSDKLCGLVQCHGDVKDALLSSKDLIVNAEMKEAHAFLSAVFKVIEKTGNAGGLRLDFSLFGDDNYYNGLFMNGFVRSVPKAVLSGGQYDKLLEKFEIGAQAIGFAVYLGELAAILPVREKSTDILLIYGDCRAEKVAKKAQQLRKKGYSVRSEKTLPQSVNAKEVFIMEKTND